MDLSGLSAQAQIRAELCRTYQCFRSQWVSVGCHFYGLNQGGTLSSDRTVSGGQGEADSAGYSNSYSYVICSS